MNLNKVFLLGRVATDPEMKSTGSGQNVCTFSLATNRVWKDANGQKKEDSQFHRIVLWQRLAQIASQFLTKGSLVLIEGRIQTRAWDDKTGNKRYTTEIIAENMQLGPRSGNAPMGASNFNAQPQQPKNNKKEMEEEDIPVIEDGEEIDIKDIPF